MLIEEIQKMCSQRYPNCKGCKYYKHDCERYEEGHDLYGMDRILPKDWNIKNGFIHNDTEIINMNKPINVESKNTTIKVTAPAIAFTEDGVYKVIVKNNKVTVMKEG